MSSQTTSGNGSVPIANQYVPSDVHPLTPSERNIISSTVPVLAQHGAEVTRLFYSRLISEYPDLKNLFSYSGLETGRQADALANAVLAYAQNIDNLGPLLPVVGRVGQKHAALGVKPEHYAVVGEGLLRALRDVVGPAFEGDLRNAWYNAYWQLARVFIDAEDKFVKQAPWTGWREFKVARKIKESSEITSFHLVPVDEDKSSPLPIYEPGQYLTVRVWVEKLGTYQNRHYSLSDAPNPSHYRISVKRELGLPTAAGGPSAHPGWLSNVIHDTVHEGSTISAAPPFGDFHLSQDTTDSDSPVLLISAGVGVTPVLSMLQALSKRGQEASKRPITWIHCARSKASHAFREDVKHIVDKSRGKAESVVFYTQPEANDAVQGKDYDFSGRMDLDRVGKDRLRLGQGANYYICGPELFMPQMSKKLQSLGEDAGHIHMELFGSGEIKS